MRAERSFIFPHNVLHPKWELVVKISKTMIEFFGENGHQTLSVAIDKPIFLYVTNPSFLPQGVKT